MTDGKKTYQLGKDVTLKGLQDEISHHYYPPDSDSHHMGGLSGLVPLILASTSKIPGASMGGLNRLVQSAYVYQKLKEELISAWPNLESPPKWSDLEKLPYLSAVVKEFLRISLGVASPLPRVIPSSGAKIADAVVPPNTVVGISSHFVHRSADIFETPDEFIPERWIGEKGQLLDKWLVTFSKGRRSCLGQQLAWSELYLCFAHVYRRFDIEMDSSSPKTLEWRDCFLPEYLGPHLRAKMTAVKS